MFETIQRTYCIFILNFIYFIYLNNFYALFIICCIAKIQFYNSIPCVITCDKFSIFFIMYIIHNTLMGQRGFYNYPFYGGYDGYNGYGNYSGYGGYGYGYPYYGAYGRYGGYGAYGGYGGFPYGYYRRYW